MIEVEGSHDVQCGCLFHCRCEIFRMNSKDLAQYIEMTDGASKPWLLVQLRLKKLQERRASLSSVEYLQELADIQQDLMNLGEWWVGIEAEVFGTNP